MADQEFVVQVHAAIEIGRWRRTTRERNTADEEEALKDKIKAAKEAKQLALRAGVLQAIHAKWDEMKPSFIDAIVEGKSPAMVWFSVHLGSQAEYDTFVETIVPKGASKYVEVTEIAGNIAVRLYVAEGLSRYCTLACHALLDY